MNGQLDIFSIGCQPLKIDKPIRLIECFAGYGSQALSLKYLGVKFEHHRICEWAVKSIQAYKDLHMTDDNTDYSKDLSYDEVVDYLYSKGISSNYNEPMTREQIARFGSARTVYNNIIATNNLVSVCNVKGEDLGIVDTDKYTYLLTYSFPCQDLSMAGQRKGMGKDSGTRSGLLWEVERILSECENKPQILLMENVPEVVGEKNKKHFSEWIKRLDELGYNSKWQIINGTDFGMPQNRKRCFMVSVLGNYYYTFPNPTGCELRLKDLLEQNVDEKYYLSQNIVEYFVRHTEECKEKGNGFKFEPTYGDGIAKCITTRAGARMDDNFIYRCDCVGNMTSGKWEKINESCRRVYSTEQASPTITTCAGGNQEVKILEPILVGGFGDKKSNGGTQLYQQDRVYSTESVAMCHCASIPSGSYNYLVEEATALDEQNGYLRKDGTVGTIVTDGSSPKHNNRVVLPNARVRKLTPRECFRLMGVKDEDFDKVAQNQSNSILYHLAGDSIITNCLMAIFKEML